MHLTMLLPLLLLLQASSSISSGCTRRFRSVDTTANCLPSSLAVAEKSGLPDSLSCLIFTSNIAKLQCDLCVVQYAQYTQHCKVFALQDVCAEVFTGALQSEYILSSCYTYVDAAALALRKRFDGVWIPSVRAVSGLRNLICRNGVQNNFAGENVVYDYAGAPPRLNGRDSSLYLAEAAGFHWTDGLAWLFRIKRYPQTQPYLDYCNCDNGAMGASMWEWNSPGTLFYDSYGRLLPNVKVETRFNRRLVVETQDQWVDLGVTVSNLTEKAYMYYHRSFINSANFNYSTRIYHGAAPRRCIRFGSSDSANNYWFKGHVRLIAVANAYRGAREMNWLFDLFN